MYKQGIAILTFAVIISVFQSASAEVVEICNYCSENQMEHKALATIRGEGHYQINVLDMSNYNLKTFAITRIKDKEVGFIDSAHTIEASTELKVAVQDLQSTADSVKRTISAPIAIEQITPYIPGPNVTSAHGVATSEFDKGLMENALKKYFSTVFGASLKVILEKLGSQVLQGIIAHNTVTTVKWSDGTTYQFSLGKFSFDLSTSEVTIEISAIAKSGTDGGVFIPETFKRLNYNSSNAGPATLQRFLESARKAGIEIVNVGTGSTTGNVTSFSCNPKGTRCHVIIKHKP